MKSFSARVFNELVESKNIFCKIVGIESATSALRDKDVGNSYTLFKVESPTVIQPSVHPIATSDQITQLGSDHVKYLRSCTVQCRQLKCRYH